MNNIPYNFFRTVICMVGATVPDSPNDSWESIFLITRKQLKVSLQGSTILNQGSPK
jgi:hypothetical protein